MKPEVRREIEGFQVLYHSHVQWFYINAPPIFVFIGTVIFGFQTQSFCTPLKQNCMVVMIILQRRLETSTMCGTGVTSRIAVLQDQATPVLNTQTRPEPRTLITSTDSRSVFLKRFIIASDAI